MSKRKPMAVQHDITLAAMEALIAKHDGHLSPRILLDEASDSRSPFHSMFEWDDSEAGEQYRLIQASQIIRRWKGSIMRVDAQAQVVTISPVRRVQSPAGQRGKGQDSYETIEAIMADPAKRADMIDTVLRELLSYRKRYRQLNELAEIWSAIDEATLQFSSSAVTSKSPEPEYRPTV